MRSEVDTGHGYGPDALAAMVAHLQAALGIHRFLLRPSARNPRAVRAYQKAGFEIVPMSVRQQVETYGPGGYEDTLVMICQLPIANCLLMVIDCMEIALLRSQ